MLVLVDAVLLVADVLHLRASGDPVPAGPFLGDRWDGQYDGSYVELWGHAQLLLAVLLLLVVAEVRRSVVYLAWAAVVLALVVDDFAQVHERVGGVLDAALDLPGVPGLRPQDVGELLVWVVLSLLLGSLVVLSTWRAPRRVRRDSLLLLACVVLLAVFAVGVDQLHVVAGPYLGGTALRGVTLLETAGELVGMTLLAVAAVWTTAPWAADGGGRDR